jgi:hypothetical protein
MTTTLNINSADETHGSISGTQVSLYLIPADETNSGVAEVTIFRNVGPGCPEPAWNNRWHCLGSLAVDFVADSLVEVLESQRDTLEHIAASYLGSRWNGSNHVGRWAESVDDIQIELDCETYCPASDWLGCDWPSVDREILSAESLESMAEDIVDDAAGTARLMLDDVLDCLIQRASDLKTEKLDAIVGEIYLYEDEACDAADGQTVALRGDWFLINNSGGENCQERLDEATAVRLLTGSPDSDISGPACDWLVLAALLDEGRD